VVLALIGQGLHCELIALTNKDTQRALCGMPLWQSFNQDEALVDDKPTVRGSLACLP
jgi:hypothetical protein